MVAKQMQFTPMGSAPTMTNSLQLKMGPISPSTILFECRADLCASHKDMVGGDLPLHPPWLHDFHRRTVLTGPSAAHPILLHLQNERHFIAHGRICMPERLPCFAWIHPTSHFLSPAWFLISVVEENRKGKKNNDQKMSLPAVDSSACCGEAATAWRKLNKCFVG